MKAFRNIIIIILVIGIVVYFLPGGYFSYFVGKYFELTGNKGSALEWYQTAYEEAPENAGYIRAYARSINDLAEEREDAKLFMDAWKITDKWVKENSNHDVRDLILIELARAEWGRGRKQQARVAIDEAVDLSPTNYEALVYQGIIYRDTWTSRENIRQSIPIFEQALQVRNNKSTYWAELELAKAWWKLGDETHALAELDQALSQFPPRWVRVEAERLKHEIQSSGRSER